MVKMQLLTGLALVATTGCGGHFDGDLRVRDFRVDSTPERTVVEIDLVNEGRSAVWVWQNLVRIAVDPESDEVILALHADTPGTHLPSAAVDLLVHFEKLHAPANPVFSNSQTLEFEFSDAGNDAASDKIRYADREDFFVEVAWYDEDPGQVTKSTVPSPDGVAFAEWHRTD